MYDWLVEALEDDALVVTANRRLASVLADHYGELQRAVEAALVGREQEALEVSAVVPEVLAAIRV